MTTWLRRVLFCLLLSVSFDAAVPFELTVAGTFTMGDELDDAAMPCAIRDHASEAYAAANRRDSVPPRVVTIARAELAAPRLVAERSDVFPVRTRALSDLGTSSPPTGDDH